MASDLMCWVYKCASCSYSETWPRKRTPPPKCEAQGHGRMQIVKLPGQER